MEWLKWEWLERLWPQARNSAVGQSSPAHPDYTSQGVAGLSPVPRRMCRAPPHLEVGLPEPVYIDVLRRVNSSNHCKYLKKNGRKLEWAQAGMGV